MPALVDARKLKSILQPPKGLVAMENMKKVIPMKRNPLVNGLDINVVSNEFAVQPF